MSDEAALRARISSLLDLCETWAVRAGAAERVVAAQREALRLIADRATYFGESASGKIARAALREGVSEPDQAGGGESADSRATRSGSLTSPVDTAGEVTERGPRASVWTRIVLAARESEDWRLRIEIEQAVQQAQVPMPGWIGP